MNYTTLGRTGLQVSVLGLGGGGHSRLGQATGNTQEESVALVRHALSLGINFIDTAESYGTEAIIGQALRGHPREEVVLSTKKTIRIDGNLVMAEDVRQGLENSLKRLEMEYVDIYHLHAVRPEDYEHAHEQLVPMLLQLQTEGKIRFLGITEMFAADTGHQMLQQAVQGDSFDVVMVGFNILNQSARERVLTHTRRQNVSVLDMFAVRQAFSQMTKLREILSDLVQQGAVDKEAIDEEFPLGFLVRDGSAHSLVDAAYRFCRQEPGVHVVLSGTGSVQHLEENVDSILRPALPESARQHLIEIFARVDSVSGQ